MGEALDRLKSGNFNSMWQAWQPDGSVVIALMRRGDTHTYRIAIRDWNKESEVVLWEETEGHTRGH